MKSKGLLKRRFRQLYYFFPLQLVILHFKQNQLLLLLWAILFGFITNRLASSYGISYLFLAPEYLHKVNIYSYFVLGIILGLFIMTYHISSYSVNASRFPFIATLNRPFLKYCTNNFFFPLIFMAAYGYCIYRFYLINEGTVTMAVYFYILALYTGAFACMLFSYLYFFSTNKNIFTFFGMKKPAADEPVAPNPKDLPKIKRKWWEFFATLQSAREWKVETYLTSLFMVRIARRYEHYDKDIIVRVFNQNHLNATRLMILVFGLFLATSLFREYSYLIIPAGASLMLLFTIILMIVTAIYSWFRGWTVTLIILGILAYNFFSKYETLRFRNKAFGLNYSTEKASYNDVGLKNIIRDKENYNNDVKHTLGILKSWKAKNTNPKQDKKLKPRIAFICTSGGGLRSCLWTTTVLQLADSLLDGNLLKRTFLMTGSSGGMLGAAYIRELYLRKIKGEINNFYDDSIPANISKDLLNPLSFSLVVNDFFLRIQKFRDGNYIYTKDRGYSFERQLNINTHHILEKRLRDYTPDEEKALIPVMVITPTIINDGRRLVIAAQPVSYLTYNLPGDNVTNLPLVESIEFSRFFEKQDAMNLQFTTALRINATFPYIMPVVSLPGEPVIEVLDAGNRDNFGLITTIKSIYTFREWINNNTSGAVIILVRDSHKDFSGEVQKIRTPLENFINPLGQFYSNSFKIQDYNNDQLVEFASAWFKGNIEIVSFQLRNEGEHKISLSWHLTEREKEDVKNSVGLPENQQAFEKLRALLD